MAGDFNAEVSEPVFDNFLGTQGLKSLTQDNTCFKSLAKPTCIDLFLTNSMYSFKNSSVISAGISDFHKMIVTVLKTTIVKGKPRYVYYRDYKHFDNLRFKNDLSIKLNASPECKSDFTTFQKTFSSA